MDIVGQVGLAANQIRLEIDQLEQKIGRVEQESILLGQEILQAQQLGTSVACAAKKMGDDSKKATRIIIITGVAMAIFGALALSGVTFGISALVGGVTWIAAVSIPKLLNVDKSRVA